MKPSRGMLYLSILSILAASLASPGPVNADTARESAAPTSILQIAGRNAHNCAVTQAGDLLCWGYDLSGQLGTADGRWENRSTPARVPNLSGVKMAAPSVESTCALLSTGGVKCWGDNSAGAFGVPSDQLSESITPVSVPGLPSGITALYSGPSDGYCALTSAGEVTCWGSGVTPPAKVTGFTKPVVSLGLGDGHTCAVQNDGKVYCWGKNNDGQLGTGEYDNDQASPVPVVGLDGQFMVAVAAGSNFTCAVSRLGEAWCWGASDRGQIGAGPDYLPVFPNSPVKVSLLTNAAAISTGADHACALTSAGDVWCWGSNRSGQLGDGTRVDRPAPVKVLGLKSAALQLLTGYMHTCALLNNGKVMCWGSNRTGQLGDSAPLKQPLPITPAGLTSGVAYVTVGWSSSCALKTDGSAYCWGLNYDGGLGDGTTLDSSTPVKVQGLSDPLTAITTANDTTCGLNNQGLVQCWGRGQQGQLGDGQEGHDSLTPVTVGLSGVTAVDGNFNAFCAVTNQGALWCWGNDNSTPHQVIAGGVTQVAMGAPVSCAVVSGAVQCWWDGEDAPVTLAQAPAGARQISMQWQTLCVLGSSKVACANGWPGNLQATAFQDASVPNFAAIAQFEVGSLYYCYRTTGGAVQCAGKNNFGILGNGTFTDRWSFANVSGLGSGVTQLAGEWSHACAVKSGKLFCWGDASNGALGDGTPLYRSAPVEVVGLKKIPAITLNYETGQPGSVIRAVGSDFTPDAAQSVSVNGRALGSVTADASGAFMVNLDTQWSSEGDYYVRAVEGQTAVVQSAALPVTVISPRLVLDDAAPLRVQEGSAVTFIIQPDTAVKAYQYLTFTRR